MSQQNTSFSYILAKGFLKRILESPTLVTVPELRQCLDKLSPTEIEVMKKIHVENTEEIYKMSLDEFQKIQSKYDVMLAFCQTKLRLTPTIKSNVALLCNAQRSHNYLPPKMDPIFRSIFRNSSHECSNFHFLS